MTNRKRYHFIGINGIGMSALAKILVTKGHIVSGSDHSPNINIKVFEKMGIKAHPYHDVNHIEPDQIVIVSSAIDSNNVEFIAAKEKECTIIKRGTLLANIASEFKSCIAVAGTHGKTTTSSLIVHIFEEANLNPSYFVGGHLMNNRHHAAVSSKEIFITEVDESDGSFLEISANQALVTNIEKDHVDYYKNRSELVDSFSAFIDKNMKLGEGKCSINLDDSISSKLIKSYPEKSYITYGIESEKCMIKAENIEYSWSGIKFSLIINQNKIEDVQVSLFGRHNIYNVLAAISIAMINDIPLKYIINGIKSFKGVGRRLELKYKANEVVLYDDYAHHPTEVLTTLEGLHKSFANQRVITIFQPHRYSRLTDFFNEFSESFYRSNITFIVPVFSAGESAKQFKTSKDLVAEINQKKNSAEYCDSFSQVTEKIRDIIQPNDIILIMGAGDISLISKQIIPVIQNR